MFELSFQDSANLNIIARETLLLYLRLMISSLLHGNPSNQLASMAQKNLTPPLCSDKMEELVQQTEVLSVQSDAASPPEDMIEDITFAAEAIQLALYYQGLCEVHCMIRNESIASTET